MLKYLLAFCTWACAACASTQATSSNEVRQIRIYGAHVLQGEYGTAIMDPDCPSAGFMVKIDPSLDGSEFLKVLRYGGGKLGPASKYVVINGIVQSTGKLADRGTVTLVRVDSIREQVIDAQHYMNLSESLGCEKDAARRRAWLDSLQHKLPRR